MMRLFWWWRKRRDKRLGDDLFARRQAFEYWRTHFEHSGKETTDKAYVRRMRIRNQFGPRHYEQFETYVRDPDVIGEAIAARVTTADQGVSGAS